MTEIFVIEKVSSGHSCDEHHVVWVGVDRTEAHRVNKEWTDKVRSVINWEWKGPEINVSIWVNGECVDDNPQEFFIPR